MKNIEHFLLPTLDPLLPQEYVSPAAGAGVGAGLGALSSIGTGVIAGSTGTQLGVSAVLAAGAGALQVGLGALGLYGAGMLHNLVWATKNAKQPGMIGTAARGVIAPLFVPVGLVYRAVRGR